MSGDCKSEDECNSRETYEEDLNTCELMNHHHHHLLLLPLWGQSQKPETSALLLLFIKNGSDQLVLKTRKKRIYVYLYVCIHS